MDKLKKLERMAWLLDNSFRIPGTSIRMGLDSLIGLIPGIGDTTGGILSSYIIWQAARMGVPRVVLMRMGVNVVFETLLGAVPLVGDIFDIAFKANQKNVQLLSNYYQSPQASVERHTVSIVLIAVAIIAVIGLVIWLTIKLLAWLINAIG
ncbi:DUF4112 domain-containing protein [Methylobacter sp. BBA5.1]|uniref:DUF4112 domain-containing protein n=1 Tax=Methylobacter sp. BBA5.1 TaxID=1495064 RepID=UPI00055EFDF4|nr:DUF4112 domain-containing protein [Methylobacter sp. BBA5.1]